MRFLTFFLILCCLPILADEKNSTDDPKEKIEQVAKPSINDKMVETPASDMQKTTESYETAFIKTIVVLIGLLLLVILTVWMFKKISRGRLRTFNYQKSVKILEKRPLSPKTMLYLIEVGGKQVLISESQFEIHTVTTLDYLDEDKDL